MTKWLHVELLTPRLVFVALILSLFSFPFAQSARAQQQMVTVAGLTSPAPPLNAGTQTTNPSNPTQTGLHFPNAVAVDGFGNFYIADGLNAAIREVSCSDMITYALMPNSGGIQATAVATDPLGDVFYADSVGNIYKNTADLYVLNTIGVTGGYFVVPSFLTSVSQPVLAMTADAQGNLYVLSATSDGNGGYHTYTITKVGPQTPTPTVTQLAGDFIPDADLFDSMVSAGGLAIDAVGNLYTYVRDGRATPNAMYNQILQITQSGAISDFGNYFITLPIPVSGSIMALAPNSAGLAEAGLPGTFYIALGNGVYAFVPGSGATASTLTLVAGTGLSTFNGDGAALTSDVNAPNGVAVDNAGALYIADTNDNLVRRVANPGYVSPSCGNGIIGTPSYTIPNYGFGRMNTTTDEFYLAVNRGNYTEGGPAGAVVVFDARTDSVLANIPLTSIPADMAVDSTNNFIYTANSDGSVSIIDGASNTLLQTLSASSLAVGTILTSKGLQSIAVDPGNGVVYTVGNDDADIYMLQGPVRGASTITPAVGLKSIGNILPLGSVAVDTQRHKAYTIVDGPAQPGELNYTLAVIDGTQNPPVLSNTYSYLANASSTNIAHDALAVETTSGKVIIADAEDRGVSTFDPSVNLFQHASQSFFPNHVAVDSTHQEAYIFDGYGNAVVMNVTNSSQVTLNSITINSNSQGCGIGAGVVGVDASVDQAYFTTCDLTNGAAIHLWDGNLQEAISSQSIGSAANLATDFSITVNPFIHSIYLSDALQTPATQQILVFGGPTPSSAPAITIAPSSFTFGSSASPIANGTTVTQTFTIGNNGAGPITQLNFQLTSASSSSFSILPSPTTTCAAPLAVNATCTITVAFTSTTSGESYAGLELLDDSGDTPQLIGVAGYGLSIPITLTISPATLPSAMTAASFNTTFHVTNSSNVITWNLCPSGVTTFNASVCCPPGQGTLGSPCPAGLLPSGLNSFDNFDGFLIGTPTQTGTFPITIIATDAQGDKGTQNYTLIVNQGILVSLGLQPSTITAGGTSTGTATLNQTSASTTNLFLTSSNPNVTFVPTSNSIAIPAGMLMGTFTIQANTSFTATTVVTINVNYNGVFTPQTLTVNPGPPPVSVPNVVGLTQAAASTAITGAGLTVGTITMASSATVPSGSVISENPVATTSVASGSAVNLVISLGPAPVSVPNVVGLTQAAASTAITGAGLTVGTITMASSATVPSGSVISENPVATTSVASGSAVNLVISLGPAPVSVPNVVGLTQAAASTAITGAGLTVGTITMASSATVPSGSVISENPVATTSVASGSAVNLVISTGPPPTPPTATATPATLSFGLQVDSNPLPAIPGTAQSVTLKNTSTTATLTGIAPTITPGSNTNAGDFSIASTGTTCTTTLAAGATCIINITFAPSLSQSAISTSGASESATLSIADNASSPEPQTVALSGTAVPFTAGALSTSGTVTGGQTYMDTITITLAPGTGTLVISCAGLSGVLPSGTTCLFSDSAFPTPAATLSIPQTSAVQTVMVTVTVTTTSGVFPQRRPNLPPTGLPMWLPLSLIAAVLLLGLWINLAATPKHRPRTAWAFLVLIVLCGGWLAACSSSPSGSSGPTSTSDTFVVTAKLGNVTQTINIVLQVNQ